MVISSKGLSGVSRFTRRAEQLLCLDLQGPESSRAQVHPASAQGAPGGGRHRPRTQPLPSAPEHQGLNRTRGPLGGPSRRGAEERGSLRGVGVGARHTGSPTSAFLWGAWVRRGGRAKGAPSLRGGRCRELAEPGALVPGVSQEKTR